MSRVIVAELDAAAVWPNKASLQALVRLEFEPEADPWLIHATYVVAEVREDCDIARRAFAPLMHNEPFIGWHDPEGAPFRMAIGSRLVRMRLTEAETGTWVDFDVRRSDLRRYLAETFNAVDTDAERAAFTAALDAELENL